MDVAGWKVPHFEARSQTKNGLWFRARTSFFSRVGDQTTTATARQTDRCSLALPCLPSFLHAREKLYSNKPMKMLAVLRGSKEKWFTSDTQSVTSIQLLTTMIAVNYLGSGRWPPWGFRPSCGARGRRRTARRGWRRTRTRSSSRTAPARESPSRDIAPDDNG